MDEEAYRTRWQIKIKWRHRQHCEWSRQQHVLLYVIKWQMIRFQALWKTKLFDKVCLKFKLPLWTKGLLIHLSPLWQLPLWHFPRWHNFPVYWEWIGIVISCIEIGKYFIEAVSVTSEYPQDGGWVCCCYDYPVDAICRIAWCIAPLSGIRRIMETHVMQKKSTHEMAAGKRLTASILLCKKNVPPFCRN